MPISSPNIPGFAAGATFASFAAALNTPRLIGGVTFNATANIDLPGVNVAGNQNTTGSANTAGYATSAGRLSVARLIGGVSFDGQANIDLPGVNVAGNQNTSGNAATTSQRDWSGSSYFRGQGRFVGWSNANGADELGPGVEVGYSSGLPYVYAYNRRTLTDLPLQLNGSEVNSIPPLKQNGNQVLHAANFNTYTPTLTGVGASGNWPIAITGNAATSTKFSSTSGSAPVYAARAWVNFNGTGTVAIRASGNVSSVTDNSAGDYTINFSIGMADANYSVSASCGYNGAPGYPAAVALNAVNSNGATVAPTANAVRINTRDFNGDPTDIEYINVTIFR